MVASAETLGSHQDHNFLLTSTDGAHRLLKVANPGTSVAELEAQSVAARLVAGAAPRIRVPLALDPETGADSETGASTVRVLEHEGQSAPARVLDYLDGRTLSGSGHLAPRAVRALGQLAAQVDLALVDFEHPGTLRESQWDLRRAADVLAVLLPYVGEAALRERLQDAATEATTALAAVAHGLPEQVIHGDLTDDNVVSRDAVGRIPDGVIDFGDLNRTWTVGELAVTVSSLLHHDGVDIARAMAAVAGYHQTRPLTRAEAEALWPLVVIRAAVLVASGHHVMATDPGNLYAEKNMVHERAIFEEATSVPLPVVTARVLATVGSAADETALPAHGPLLDGLDPDAVSVLDLSATSAALDHGRWLEPGVEEHLAEEAVAVGASAVITRFAEPRLTGATPAATAEPANTALTVEVTVARPHHVQAPWPGSVLRTPAGLLLRHDEVDLHLDGIDPEVPDGTWLPAGATLGRGHTRFRVRVTRTGTDAPGVVRAGWARAWRALVADPTPLLLGRALPDPRQDPEALAARRRRVLAEVQEHYYDEPPHDRARLAAVPDRHRRRACYLDMVNNVTSIGHAHPRLTEAVAEQWRLLNTNSRFHYRADRRVRRAARRDCCPTRSTRSSWSTAGSEAVDLALRIARACYGPARTCSRCGRPTTAGRSLTRRGVDLGRRQPATLSRPARTGCTPSTRRTPTAARTAATTRTGTPTEAVAEIDGWPRTGHGRSAPSSPSPSTATPAASPCPDGYLAAVYAAVRTHGGLAIADEVQVGYGRLGDWFWGFEQQGVVPDIVAVAKAMGNGHPLGAVITSREIAERYRTQGYFFSSAGGSPVSLRRRAGRARRDPRRGPAGERARGRRPSQGAAGRSSPSGIRLIGAVHGSGLYLGLEFVRDRRHPGAGDRGDRRHLRTAARPRRHHPADRRPPVRAQDQAAAVHHPRRRRRLRGRPRPRPQHQLVRARSDQRRKRRYGPYRRCRHW